MTPGGIAKLSKSDREESTIVYLNIDEETRKTRLAARRDADDVKRRLDADYADFLDFKDFDYEIKDPNFKDIGDIGNVYFYIRKND
jgi:guanylate kinase